MVTPFDRVSDFSKPDHHGCVYSSHCLYWFPWCRKDVYHSLFATSVTAWLQSCSSEEWVRRHRRCFYLVPLLFLFGSWFYFKVDSKLAQQSNLAAVNEILNGCMWVDLLVYSLNSGEANVPQGVVYSLGRCKMLFSRSKVYLVSAWKSYWNDISSV